ncbi:MAG: toll/interleukin-1 receptor domain-containing protein [Alphaproteobacteria bacterium]|nr:toll/interleukin-1 receptor domain-containing protein [Alphaproteobacteria bacterium]
MGVGVGGAGMKYDIFVSYRRSDREFVAQLVLRLEARGVGVWYDAKLDGGDDWPEAIVEALTAADMLVIFFSEDCNNSRQLKKELAVADSLEKPVIPVLIEDTRPRGAYLYQLADRNWIQAFPNPMGKIDELVEHLTMLAGKSEGGLAGLARPSPAPAEPSPTPGAPPILWSRAEALEAAAPAADPAASTMDLPPETDLFASRKTAAPPRMSDAYIGQTHKGAAGAARLNDILPFRWIDLVFLAPLVGGFAWYLRNEKTFADGADALFEPLSIGILCCALVGFYGALVFPVRYYLRRRPLWSALRNYLISSFILYAVVTGSFLAAWSYGLFPNDAPAEFALFFGLVWLAFTVIAFLIYAVLAGQRAIRSFRSNIKKI